MILHICKFQARHSDSPNGRLIDIPTFVNHRDPTFFRKCETHKPIPAKLHSRLSCYACAPFKDADVHVCRCEAEIIRSLTPYLGIRAAAGLPIVLLAHRWQAAWSSRRSVDSSPSRSTGRLVTGWSYFWVSWSSGWLREWLTKKRRLIMTNPFCFLCAIRNAPLCLKEVTSYR